VSDAGGTEEPSVARLARVLLEVRDGAPLLDPPPPALEPPTVAAAYEVAARVVEALSARHGPVRGYKIGATSDRGQQLLGLVEPFHGCAFAQAILADDATYASGGRECTIEAEIGFVVARDLPPRAESYSYEEVCAALARAVPLFEVNRPAYARALEIGGRWLIADNGVTQAFAVGGPGRALDRSVVVALRDESLRMLRNGVPVAEGAARVVLGDPLRAVQWLANALAGRGRGLRAGDVIASGATTPPVPMHAGDAFAAEYSSLGRVRLHVG
jgi:2-keto-4-pentenoate hydratase